MLLIGGCKLNSIQIAVFPDWREHRRLRNYSHSRKLRVFCGRHNSVVIDCSIQRKKAPIFWQTYSISASFKLTDEGSEIPCSKQWTELRIPASFRLFWSVKHGCRCSG